MSISAELPLAPLHQEHFFEDPTCLQVKKPEIDTAPMTRHEIISVVGKQYYTSNLENGEFSYPRAFKDAGKEFVSRAKPGKTDHIRLDLRFVDGAVSVLIETKDNFDRWNAEATVEQLRGYAAYEKELTGNKIVVILANTHDDRIKVWWGSDLLFDDSHQLKNQYKLKTFTEYSELYTATTNDREQVIKNTYSLNEILHKHGIGEKIRSQFVGTCLLALNKELKFERLSTKVIICGIEEAITELLEKDLNKAVKLAILKTKVLDSQDVRSLKPEEMQEILRHIDSKILPYINAKITTGQDILNLFFTTFNKFVGKSDKNQAFTPDHIVHFMSQVVGVNRHSRVLDPCSGSGTFLVRAMTEALDDCADEQERNTLKKTQIYGIEFEETAFGLSTTNMLIHGDGNSNVKQGSCFEAKQFIEEARINVVLMNPPYNAQRKCCDPAYVTNWDPKTKEDPSQGFHYVHYVASVVKTGRLAVLLPMQCAIGTSKEIQAFKEKMLQEHTLDAVFSLPPDIFHPGANASACCMVFTLGGRHNNAVQPTFFGYYKDDGFIKRKNLGRVEKTKPNSSEGVWADIESHWLDLYRNRKEEAGLSVVKSITAKDEWLAEAYIETDYSKITAQNFERAVIEYAGFSIRVGILDEKSIRIREKIALPLDTSNWRDFKVGQLFRIEPTKGVTTDDLAEGNELPYIAAKKDSNGLEMMCSKEGNEDFISTGNCVVFVQLGQGSAGYSTYQGSDFIGMNGKTSCGYNEQLNKYIGLFLVAILDLERPKFSFGRSWTGERLKNTTIRLPSIKNGGDHIPDWSFMEHYIKSLPYSDLI
jgi:type I restriction-modification system DNA methylase subunit